MVVVRVIWVNLGVWASSLPSYSSFLWSLVILVIWCHLVIWVTVKCNTSHRPCSPLLTVVSMRCDVHTEQRVVGVDWYVTISDVNTYVCKRREYRQRPIIRICCIERPSDTRWPSFLIYCLHTSTHAPNVFYINPYKSNSNQWVLFLPKLKFWGIPMMQ